MPSDKLDLLSIFDQQQRIDIDYPQARKEITDHIVRFVQPAPGMNFISYSRIDEYNADEAIDEQIAYFSQYDQPFTWKVYDHDMPKDLKERLVQRGATPDDTDAVMVLDLAEPPSALLESEDIPITEITTRQDLNAVITILEEVWGGSFAWVTDRLGGHLEIPGYLNVYVAAIADQPIAVGWVYFHEASQFASLWGGSTVEAFRGRGLYTALLARRVHEAIQRGYRYLVIDTSPMSRPIVEKNGFQLLTFAQDYEWKQEIK